MLAYIKKLKIIDDSYAFSNALNGFKLHYRKMGKSLFLTIIDKFNFFKGILLGNECVRADHVFALGVFALGGFEPSCCLWVFSTWIEICHGCIFHWRIYCINEQNGELPQRYLKYYFFCFYFWVENMLQRTRFKLVVWLSGIASVL